MKLLLVIPTGARRAAHRESMQIRGAKRVTEPDQKPRDLSHVPGSPARHMPWQRRGPQEEPVPFPASPWPFFFMGHKQSAFFTPSSKCVPVKLTILKGHKRAWDAMQGPSSERGRDKPMSSSGSQLECAGVLTALEVPQHSAPGAVGDRGVEHGCQWES